MTRDQDFERHLSDWLAEGPATAPDEVVGEALERTVERRQHHPRRVRLAAVLDRLPEFRPNMMSPVPLATVAVMTVVLLAAAMLTFEPLNSGPGAAPPMDASMVRTVDGDVALESTTETAGGSQRVIRIETDDPRIRGQASQVLALEETAETGLQRSAGVMRLVNDWGAWEGPITGVRYPDGTEIEYGWLTGEGAYAGFSYFHSTRHHSAEAERVLEGAIWPGEPPPMPDPSLLAADPLG